MNQQARQRQIQMISEAVEACDIVAVASRNDKLLSPLLYAAMNKLHQALHRALDRHRIEMWADGQAHLSMIGKSGTDEA